MKTTEVKTDPEEEKTTEAKEETTTAAGEEESTKESAFSLKEPEEEEEAVAKQKERKPQRLDLLDQLFAFVRQKEELNPVLCGYFTKLTNIFLMKRATEFHKYVFSEHGLLECFARHLYSKSLSEILVKFMNIDDVDDISAEELAAKKRNVLEIILERLAPDTQEEDHLNAAQVLCELAS